MFKSDEEQIEAQYMLNFLFKQATLTMFVYDPDALEAAENLLPAVQEQRTKFMLQLQEQQQKQQQQLKHNSKDTSSNVSPTGTSHQRTIEFNCETARCLLLSFRESLTQKDLTYQLQQQQKKSTSVAMYVSLHSTRPKQLFIIVFFLCFWFF